MPVGGYDIRAIWRPTSQSFLESFERDDEYTGDWTISWSGGSDPVMANLTGGAYEGLNRLSFTWKTGNTNPQGRLAVSGFVVGQSYTASCQGRRSGTTNFQISVEGGATGTATTTNAVWTPMSVTFTATSQVHVILLKPTATVANNDSHAIDVFRIEGVGEELTKRLTRSAVTFQYGRDQARALSPVSPGRGAFEVSNLSRDYYPDNTSSPIYGYLRPGVEVQADYSDPTFSGTYSLFRGRVDDFNLTPAPSGTSTVSFSLIDGLGALADEEITTSLYQGIRTGEAIGVVLDEIGWPLDKRDIDVGGSVLPWWWENRGDAWNAIQKLIGSEGPPSFVTIGPDGSFIFRDRHHRLTRPASWNYVANFRTDGPITPFTGEYRASWPLDYDHGYRDIINSITLQVDERGPSPDLTAVWTSDATWTVQDGNTLPVNIDASDPFIYAQTPEAGVDYQVRSGSMTVTLGRDSGQSTTLFLKATGGPATIDTLQLRAYPVAVQRTRQIHAEDSASITKHNGRKIGEWQAPWVSANDAEAICEIILAYRADRLPIARVRLNDPNSYTANMLFDLADRVRITDDETGLNNTEFQVERIEHTITVTPDPRHEVVLGCEKVPLPAANALILGSATAGLLGTGVLSPRGLDNPQTVFIIGDATQGKLATGVLAR